jgi:hypothetical protein
MKAVLLFLGQFPVLFLLFLFTRNVYWIRSNTQYNIIIINFVTQVTLVALQIQ